MLGILSMGHMLNDMYSNFLPQLLPFLVVSIPDFSPSRAAVLVASFNISSSLFQPIFGYMVDGRGKGWLIYIGTLWMSVFLSLTGLTDNYFLMVALAAAAGLGTSAFHPPASAFVHGLDARRKAVYQSVFVAFGNIGFALAPLLMVPLFQFHGLKASWLLIIPGIFASLFLFFALPRQTEGKVRKATLLKVWASLKKSEHDIIVILAVIMLRAAAYTGLLALLPLYFHEKGFSNIAGSRALTLMLAAGALGGIAGGFISDRWGRRPLIVWSLLLATPMFFSFLLLNGESAEILLSLGGVCLLASFSVTTVVTQDLIPEQKALAAGLSLGFSNGMGAFIAIIVGKLADVWGLTAALGLLAVLPAISGIVCLGLRDKPWRKDHGTPAPAHCTVSAGASAV